MRILLRDRIDIGTSDNDTYFDPKKLPFFEQIGTGIRIALRNRPSAKRKQEELESKKYQEETERMENLKTMILQKLYTCMSPEDNPKLKESGKQAVAAVISISRGFEDIIGEILTHQEFTEYRTKIYEENSDVLKACPNLPILIRFEKKII